MRFAAALYKDEEVNVSYYAGIVAEPPSKRNDQRYVITAPTSTTALRATIFFEFATFLLSRVFVRSGTGNVLIQIV